jgi:hypothetical protein
LKERAENLSSELESTTDQLRAARIELETTRKDCAGMLKVMQAQEKQINE